MSRSILARIVCIVLTSLLTVSLAAAAPRSKKVRASQSRNGIKRVAARKNAVAKSGVTRRGGRRSVNIASRASIVLSGTKRGSKRRRSLLRRASAASYVAGGPWLEPTFADSTSGDNIDGEDLVVRRAAVEALGAFNGSVVVADAQTGRLLTIVNQKVAFASGFQPCSTIKIVAAMAGLSEGIVSRDSQVRLYGRTSMSLTDALARSNNLYFANIGVRLGYDKIAQYAKMYGLGEKAGLNIEAEQLGTIPDGPPKFGGMGMMTSFGEGIKLTPLQLTALLSAIANGGSLYYLQYPHSEAEAVNFSPRLKRRLPIQQVIPELTPGMLGATEFGTARRAAYASESTEPIFGKTGTCTDRSTPTHLGWFGSFSEVGGRKLAIVVLLTGGHYVSGPVASGVAGQIYRSLAQQKLTAQVSGLTPVALVSSPSF